jgi:hypothetical protein
MVYAAAPYQMTDSLVTDMEQGFSLNVQSRCNSSSANGLEVAFSDSPIPSTSYIYSLAGTASSGIKSLYSGSIPWVNDFSTESCSSRYGVQDVYGNVAEWMQDKMTCNNSATTTTLNNGGAVGIGATSITVTSAASLSKNTTILIESERMRITGIVGNVLTVIRASNGTVAAAHADGLTVTPTDAFVCNMVGGASGTDLGRYDFQTGLYSNTANYPYAFDLLLGPYNDLNADSQTGAGDSFLTNWSFREELFSAGKFNFPMGMPFNVNIASTDLSTSPAIPYLLDIGPTGGITTTQLHEDGFIVNGAAVNASATKTGSFAQGGSYLSGTSAGRYSSELIPDSIVNRPDVGFRCYAPVINGNYYVDPFHTYPYDL